MFLTCWTYDNWYYDSEKDSVKVKKWRNFSTEKSVEKWLKSLRWETGTGFWDKNEKFFHPILLPHYFHTITSLIGELEDIRTRRKITKSQLPPSFLYLSKLFKIILRWFSFHGSASERTLASRTLSHCLCHLVWGKLFISEELFN